MYMYFIPQVLGMCTGTARHTPGTTCSSQDCLSSNPAALQPSEPPSLPPYPDMLVRAALKLPELLMLSLEGDEFEAKFKFEFGPPAGADEAGRVCSCS